MLGVIDILYNDPSGDFYVAKRSYDFPEEWGNDGMSPEELIEYIKNWIPNSPDDFLKKYVHIEFRDIPDVK